MRASRRWSTALTLVLGMLLVPAPRAVDAAVESAAPGDPSSRLAVHVENRRALEPWWDALAARDSTPADVLLIGTSSFEGVGAGSWEERLPVALQAELRERHPISARQAAGWTPVANFAGHAVPGLTTSDPEPVTSLRFGLGSKSLTLRGRQQVRFNFVGSRVRVWFGRSDQRRTPAGLVRIDGRENRHLGRRGLTGDGHFWDSGALPHGEHRVRVRRVRGGPPVHVEAFETFGSRADVRSGVHVYDGTHGGFFSGNFTPGASVPADRAWLVADVIAPDLTVINLGTNDTALDLPSASLRANVEAMIRRVRTAAAGRPHSVLVVLPFMSVRADPEHATRMADYREALRGLAGGRVAVLDLDDPWPTLSKGQGHESGVMLEDTYPVHPNPAGHRLLRDVLVEALRRPSV